jgi:hypothetical protein
MGIFFAQELLNNELQHQYNYLAVLVCTQRVESRVKNPKNPPKKTKNAKNANIFFKFWAF